MERKKSKNVGHVRRSAVGASFDPAQLFLFVWLVEVVESPHASFRVPRMIRSVPFDGFPKLGLEVAIAVRVKNPQSRVYSLLRGGRVL